MTDLVRILTIGQNFLHEGIQYARLPEMNLREIGGDGDGTHAGAVHPRDRPTRGIPRGFEPRRILCEYLHPDTHVEVVPLDKLVASEIRLPRSDAT